MRITIVTGFFLPVPPVRGGSTEKIWHRLAIQLAAAGHTVTFISRRWTGMPDRETVEGVNHIRVRGADHHRSLAANLWLDFRWGARVARFLPMADVVICNTVTLPAWLARLKPEAGRVVAVLARMPKGHGRAYGKVDLLLALSDTVATRLKKEKPSLGPRIARFPYPIDWALHANTPRAVRSSPVTIGYVGRIHADKGITLLLEAAANLLTRPDLPPWRIELVGPSSVPEGGGGESYRDELLQRFSSVLGDRLHFTGPEFDATKLARRYAAMDIFCYPSRDSGETFGVAVAEAMAAGCTPVVSSLECFRELVHPGANGLVFDHTGLNAARTLADALDSLLRKPDLRSQFSQRAQDHARSYDFSQSATNLLVLLERIVRQSPQS
jgi:glycosyltransferase involved in cell wall biosynthesis